MLSLVVAEPLGYPTDKGEVGSSEYKLWGLYQKKKAWTMKEKLGYFDSDKGFRKLGAHDWGLPLW